MACLSEGLLPPTGHLKSSDILSWRKAGAGGGRWGVGVRGEVVGEWGMGGGGRCGCLVQNGEGPTGQARPSSC